MIVEVMENAVPNDVLMLSALGIGRRLRQVRHGEIKSLVLVADASLCDELRRNIHAGDMRAGLQRELPCEFSSAAAQLENVNIRPRFLRRGQFHRFNNRGSASLKA